MDTKTQQGFLVLADISGYTSYLAKVEIDHANEVLTELMAAIVDRFKTLLIISKLEGDAVFAYLPEAQLTRSETLLELIEATYLAFRDTVEAARRRTTCQCNACRAIPTLDLKFFVHHGSYILQNISGIRELLSSDVNLIHRLTKNQTSAATGWKAYALFTQAALTQLKLDLPNLHFQIESVEHLGDIQTYTLELRARYAARLEARRITISADEAHLISTHDYPVSPAVIWEWLNDPLKRALYAPSKNLKFVPLTLIGGRTDVGAQTHCIHGQKVAMLETVLDWRPFEYFTVEQVFKPFRERATYRLAINADGGTHLELSERGYLTPIQFIDRAIYTFMFTKMVPTKKLLENLAVHIERELVHKRADEVDTSPEPEDELKRSV
jgi:hypothetical protein